MMKAIEPVLQWSTFVAEVVRRQPQVADPEVWAAPWPDGETLRHTLADAMRASRDLDDLKRRARQLRQSYAAKVVIRDAMGLDGVQQTLQVLTAMAEGIVSGALDWLHEWQVQRYGQPMGDESGRPQRLAVWGMGKLGGGELNFSSDIDLICFYGENGQCDGPGRLDNQQFFIRLVQQLTPVLADITADGFAYRVDLRLRPFGSSGPLAMSAAGMVQYYETHGRAWERYALVKARTIAGDVAVGEALLAQLSPFVYRRYLDFSALESMRELKQKISAEVMRRGQANNIKLGPGGIREVEFWVQAFQLIYGGRRPALRTPSLYAALEALVSEGLVDAEDAAQQRADYEQLRRVENHLQMMRDEQTHVLPEAPAVQAMLAQSLGYDDYDRFLNALAPVRSRVQARFDALFAEADQADMSPWKQLWEGVHPQPEVLLGATGFDVDATQRQLAQFRDSAAVQRLSETARTRLDETLPLLLEALAEQPQCDRMAALGRLLDFVAAIVQRSVYLLLLKENPQTRMELVKLMCASAWLAQQLTRTPALLDALLDPQALYALPQPQDYHQEAAQLAQDYAEDEERFMDQLRQWRHRHVFKVAAMDVMGVLPVMQVSDHLSWIAESVLDAAARWAVQWMRRRHGGFGDASPYEGLLIIGYGKLGGYELGYGSDLDVVFLYHDLRPAMWSDGERPLEAQTWHIRAAQKILGLLTLPMPSGRAYAVDTRLRPNGQDGLLASSLESFEHYIEDRAWVWEHQALVRARAVVGAPRGRDAFTAFRQLFLCQPRDAAHVAREVVAMRNKMRAHLDRSDRQLFDLKQGRGGMVDIEFIAQYLVLAHAAEAPALARWTDTMRILEAAAQANVLAEVQAHTLQRVWQHYRALGHRLALQDRPARVPHAEVAEHVARVRALWAAILGDELI